MELEISKSVACLTGDSHSLAITTYLAKTIFPENAVIIGLGDHGESETFEPNWKFYLNRTNELLIKKNSILLMIRGNHTNDAWYVENSPYNRSNIYFVPDYSVAKINGKDCLFVGGAISIDRSMRTPGLDYWPGEAFEYNQEKIDEIKKNHNIHAIFTHSAPENCFPVGFNAFVESFFANDPTLKGELLQERRDLKKLYDSFPSAVLSAYGHFHSSYTEKIENRTYFLLNIEELKNITQYFS